MFDDWDTIWILVALGAGGWILFDMIKHSKKKDKDDDD